MARSLAALNSDERVLYMLVEKVEFVVDECFNLNLVLF